MSYSSKQFIFPFFFGILALMFIILSNIVEYIGGEKLHPIAWLASFSILISFLLIRYYALDMNSFSKIITETNPVSDVTLNPVRFINGMTLAYLVGLIATITIVYNFIAGMLIYLVMQICLIYAFSGIMVLNIFKLKNNSTLKKNAIISIIFWIILVIGVYFLFVYSGSSSLIVIPYVIFLGLMAHFSWYGFTYTQRSFLFRIMIILASGIFVFSDALIGNMVYGPVKYDFYVLIDLTYVINLFLMSQAILFLKNEKSESVLRI